VPNRPARYPPTHPNEHRASVQVPVRDEAYLGESTVLTIVAIVAHEKSLPGGNNRFVIGGDAILGKHDQMITITNPLDFKSCTEEPISACVLAVALRWNAGAIDEYGIVMHNDMVAREADQAFDVMSRRIRRQSKYNDVAASRLTSRQELP
jgi:hypothetical protein